jgi:hypothetical protein
MTDAAWDVINKLADDWCVYPCGEREGCGCADEIERALNAEREACANLEETTEKAADAIRNRINNSV